MHLAVGNDQGAGPTSGTHTYLDNQGPLFVLACAMSTKNGEEAVHVRLSPFVSM